MPESRYGFEWSTAHDLNPVLHMMRSLKLPPYEHLRISPWKAFWENYKPELTLLALFIVCLVLHVLRSNQLVALKAKELTEIMDERARLDSEMIRYREKLSNLERAGIVSYMSNLAAHEIRQPITNLTFFCSTLKVLIEKGEFNKLRFLDITGQISEQVSRADDIIKHLRGFAKTREDERKCFNLLERTKKVVQLVVPATSQPLIRLQVPGDLNVFGNPFEIEFVISNFIINALEATTGVVQPEIKLTARKLQNEKAEISVADNGLPISKEVFENLGKYTTSQKINGMGFGLAVISEIAEKHGGSLSFKQLYPCGLTASLIIPLRESKQ